MSGASGLVLTLFGFNIAQAFLAAIAVHIAHPSGRRAVLLAVALSAVVAAIVCFPLYPSVAPVFTRVRATGESVVPYFMVVGVVLSALSKSASSARRMQTWCAIVAVLMIPVSVALQFDAACEISGDCAL
jgi:VanZ family protein